MSERLAQIGKVRGTSEPSNSTLNVEQDQAFKTWFADSKAIDQQTGRPLVVYHGTKSDFSTFNTTKTGEFGPAIYLTSDPREASEYGEGQGWGGPSGTYIMPVYVVMKRPYESGVDAFWEEFGSTDGDALAIVRAKAAGYDGVIAKRAKRYYDNELQQFVDRSGVLTHYIAFEACQIKSATGNNGQFAADNPDIRFSMPEQPDWMSSTHVVNQQREPLVVFRGQHGQCNGQLQCLLASITFTADAAIASLYAESPNDPKALAANPFVTPAYLDISNPLFVQNDDPFVDASLLIDKLGRMTAEKYIRKYASRVEHSNFWETEIQPLFKNVDDFLNNHPERLGELFLEGWVLLDDFDFVQRALDAGFDGAISLGSGESAMSLEYRVFKAEQAKPAFEWQLRVQQYVELSGVAPDDSENSQTHAESPHG